MTRLNLLLACLLGTVTLLAQTDLPAERSNAFPYPVTNSYDSEAARDFAADFNVTDVGNLHVYDAELATGTSEDYMRGVDIAPTNYRFLPNNIKKQLSKGYKAYAVHSIRGEGESYFLVKHPAIRKGVEYSLYSFDGNKMKRLVDLAGYNCDGGACTQMDSWIRDIDGDTRLDVIQKIKKGDGPTTMRVYMQTDGGTFKRDRKANLDPVLYPLQTKS